MIAADQARFEEAVDLLLSNHNISPNASAHRSRSDVRDYVLNVLKSRLENNCLIVSAGSFPLLTYLDLSDLDIVLLVHSSQGKDIEHILAVFNALCREIADSEDDVISPFRIRNVEFINARIKLCKCWVNNIGVDITVNQIGSLATLVFLEEADRFIGQRNLFKRSLILIKSWCMNESVNYCGAPLIGGRTGGLTSYALSILVLYLFNRYKVNLKHPFSVLRCFLFTFSSFDWSKFVLTLDGHLPIINGHVTLIHDSVFNSFAEIQQSIRNLTQVNNNVANLRSERPKSFDYFLVRACNIQDPVDLNNNLGNSVTPQILQLMSVALTNGSKHLEAMLLANTVLPKVVLPPLDAYNMPLPLVAPLPHNSTSNMSSSNNCNMSDEEMMISKMRSLVVDLFPHSSNESKMRADLKDHPNQVFKPYDAAYMREGSGMLPNLDGDIEQMRLNLMLAVEMSNMNDDSYQRYVKGAQRGHHHHHHHHHNEQQQQQQQENESMEHLPMLPEEEEEIRFLQFDEDGVVVQEGDVLPPTSSAAAVEVVEVRAVHTESAGGLSTSLEGAKVPVPEPGLTSGGEEVVNVPAVAVAEVEELQQAEVAVVASTIPSSVPQNRPKKAKKKRVRRKSLDASNHSSFTGGWVPSEGTSQEPADDCWDDDMDSSGSVVSFLDRSGGSISLTRRAMLLIGRERDVSLSTDGEVPSLESGSVSPKPASLKSDSENENDLAVEDDGSFTLQDELSSTFAYSTKACRESESGEAHLAMSSSDQGLWEKGDVDDLMELLPPSSAEDSDTLEEQQQLQHLSLSSESLEMIQTQQQQQQQLQQVQVQRGDSEARPLKAPAVEAAEKVIKLNIVTTDSVKVDEARQLETVNSSKTQKLISATATTTTTSKAAVSTKDVGSPMNEKKKKKKSRNPEKRPKSDSSATVESFGSCSLVTVNSSSELAAVSQPYQPQEEVNELKVLVSTRSRRADSEQQANVAVGKNLLFILGTMTIFMAIGFPLLLMGLTGLFESDRQMWVGQAAMRAMSPANIARYHTPTSSATLAPPATIGAIGVQDTSTTGALKTFEKHVPLRIPVEPVPLPQVQIKLIWAKMGNPIRLESDVDVNEYRDVVWRKDGIDLTKDKSSEYLIRNVDRQHEGDYECYALTHVGYKLVGKTTVQLAIPPTIKSKPSYSEVYVGEQFLVALSAEGIPPPTYQWYKNGVLMPFETKNKLYFANVDTSHSGTYSCLLSNIAGTMMWLEATISVRHNPTTLQLPSLP